MKFNYIIRPTHTNGDIRNEFYYESESDAQKSLDMYRENFSGDYRCISLADQKEGIVKRILFFKEGKLMIDLSHGDIVQLKKRFLKGRNSRYIYSVTEIDDKTGKCVITCVNSVSDTRPSEVIGIDTLIPFNQEKYFEQSNNESRKIIVRRNTCFNT